MHQILSENTQITDLDQWLAFGDVSDDPIEADWVYPSQRGTSSINFQECELIQNFNTQCFLVDVDDVGSILDIEPDADFTNREFRPMEYGRRRESSDDSLEPYWEEDLTHNIEGTEITRFITNFEYEAPLIDTGFIDYHNLIEEEKRRFVEIESGDVAADFNRDVWRAKRGLSNESSDHSVCELRIRSPFLKDYLEEREMALIISHIQRRTVSPSDIVAIDQSISVPISTGTHEREFYPEQMPGLGHSCRLYWTCPILAEDIPQSRADLMAGQREHLSFTTQNGYSVTKQSIEDGSAFREMNISRPATGPDDYEYIHFDSTLLERYRNDPRGNVEEWSEEGMNVDWLDRWSVRLYRGENEQLVLLVDDLSHVGDTELSYWNQYNVTPQGGVPDEMFTNYVEADFVDTSAPAQAVLESMRGAHAAFQSVYGKPLFRDLPTDNEEGHLLTPIRGNRREFLQIAQDLDNVLVERINQSDIEDITEKSAGGTKNALFDLYEHLSDTENAVDLIAPLNALHYFRNESGHDEVRKGWEDALDELNIDDESDIIALYRLTFRRVADSLNELESLLRGSDNTDD